MQTQPVFTTVKEKDFTRFKKAVTGGKFPQNNFFGAIIFGDARIELCIDGEETNYICCNVYLANYGDGSYGRLDDVHKTPYDLVTDICKTDSIQLVNGDLDGMDLVAFAKLAIKLAKANVDKKVPLFRHAPIPYWKDASEIRILPIYLDKDGNEDNTGEWGTPERKNKTTMDVRK
jgi:hypothetical protein